MLWGRGWRLFLLLVRPTVIFIRQQISSEQATQTSRLDFVFPGVFP